MKCDQIRQGGLEDLSPDKKYKDQHFMVCQEVIDQVVLAANIEPGDRVLEIGPGPGQLTETLLEVGVQVIAIELDPRFEIVLTQIKEKYPHFFDIIWGSALEVEWPESCNKLVMNPPFSILEPLLEKIHNYRGLECVSMIIGKRYYTNAVVKPGQKGFTKTALMSQAKYKPELISQIPKECFYPEAGEKCVVMRLLAERRPNPILNRIADFYTSDPCINVNHIVQQVLDIINKRARKYKNYEDYITWQGLGIKSELKNKRLQDLSNSDLSMLVNKLTSQNNKKRKRR